MEMGTLKYDTGLQGEKFAYVQAIRQLSEEKIAYLLITFLKLRN